MEYGRQVVHVGLMGLVITITVGSVIGRDTSIRVHHSYQGDGNNSMDGTGSFAFARNTGVDAQAFRVVLWGETSN